MVATHGFLHGPGIWITQKRSFQYKCSRIKPQKREDWTGNTWLNDTKSDIFWGQWYQMHHFGTRIYTLSIVWYLSLTILFPMIHLSLVWSPDNTTLSATSCLHGARDKSKPVLFDLYQPRVIRGSRRMNRMNWMNRLDMGKGPKKTRLLNVWKYKRLNDAVLKNHSIVEGFSRESFHKSAIRYPPIRLFRQMSGELITHRWTFSHKFMGVLSYVICQKVFSAETCPSASFDLCFKKVAVNVLISCDKYFFNNWTPYLKPLTEITTTTPLPPCNGSPRHSWNFLQETSIVAAPIWWNGVMLAL